MNRPSDVIDVSDIPDLLRLAEDVHATGKARVLRRADTDLAILEPIIEPAHDVDALIARLHQNREARTHDRATHVDMQRVLHRLRERRMRRLRPS